MPIINFRATDETHAQLKVFCEKWELPQSMVLRAIVWCLMDYPLCRPEDADVDSYIEFGEQLHGLLSTARLAKESKRKAMLIEHSAMVSIQPTEASFYLAPPYLGVIERLAAFDGSNNSEAVERIIGEWFASLKPKTAIRQAITASLLDVGDKF